MKKYRRTDILLPATALKAAQRADTAREESACYFFVTRRWLLRPLKFKLNFKFAFKLRPFLRCLAGSLGRPAYTRGQAPFTLCMLTFFLVTQPLDLRVGPVDGKVGRRVGSGPTRHPRVEDVDRLLEYTTQLHHSPAV